MLSRSTEEVIALFISIAFVVDAVKGTVKSKTLPTTQRHQTFQAPDKRRQSVEGASVFLCVGGY